MTHTCPFCTRGHRKRYSETRYGRSFDCVCGARYSSWSVPSWWVPAVLLALLACGVNRRLTASEVLGGFSGHWAEAEATAYTPADGFTRDDGSNPRRLTADGTDTCQAAGWYGVAAPISGRRDAVPGACLPLRSSVVIPAGQGYAEGAGSRVFRVDDTGSIVRRRSHETGLLHVDLRYPAGHEAEAMSFGRRHIRLFVVEGEAPPTPPHRMTAEELAAEIAAVRSDLAKQVELVDEVKRQCDKLKRGFWDLRIDMESTGRSLSHLESQCGLLLFFVVLLMSVVGGCIAASMTSDDDEAKKPDVPPTPAADGA